MGFSPLPPLDIGDRDDEWILAGELIYVSRAGEVFVVPRGFVTDLASIPRLLYAVIPVNGRHRAAAILHDWLYETQRTTRAVADALFLEAMADSGVRWSQRWVMWAGVRVGGWVPWGNRAEAKAPTFPGEAP